MQWGGAHVWKIGGKVFAIGGWDEGEARITFKVSEIAYEAMQTQPGLRPAPYLASRGLKWIQQFAKPGLTDAELKNYIRQSHAMVAGGFSIRVRRELGLDRADVPPKARLSRERANRRPSRASGR